MGKESSRNRTVFLPMMLCVLVHDGGLDATHPIPNDTCQAWVMMMIECAAIGAVKNVLEKAVRDGAAFNPIYTISIDALTSIDDYLRCHMDHTINVRNVMDLHIIYVLVDL